MRRILVRVLGLAMLLSFISTSSPSVAEVVSHEAPKLYGCIYDECPEYSGSAYARFGNDLRLETGTWQSDATLSIQWFLDDQPISNATGSTYTLQVADINHSVSARVTGSAPGYSDVTVSSSSVNIVENYLLASTLPVIKSADGFDLAGMPEVGSLISVDAGSWSIPANFTYQWLRDDEIISGATSSKYEIAGADWGHEIKVRVTGTKPGYESAFIDSLPTSVGDKGWISFGPMTKQVSVSRTYACAIDSNDALTCWGNTKSGNLNVPSDMGSVKQVAVSDDNVCAIKLEGTLRCWGLNSYGEATVPSNIGKVLQISLGLQFSCAVKIDHHVSCWGRSTASAINVPSDLGSVAQISSGVAHACAITLNGGVRCWGSSLATGVPPELGSVMQISAGDYITCAVNTLGKVTCWGSRYEDDGVCEYGMQNLFCGDVVGPYGTVCSMDQGVRVCVDGKVPEDLEPAVMVSVGGPFTRRTCAVLRSGGSRCWGLNQSANFPADPQYGKAISLSQDMDLFCLVTESGLLQCPYTYNWYLNPPKKFTLRFLNLGTPRITGTSKFGSVLSAQTHATDTAITYTYSWLRDGVALDGANSPSYTPSVQDVNHKISLRVSASSYGYISSTKTLDAIEILPGDLGLAPTPQIIGERKIDSVLSVSSGNWPTGVTLSYQWIRNGEEIIGAQDPTYRIQQLDLGLNLSVRVTGQKIGYQDLIAVSQSVRPISARPASTPSPFISGSGVVGSTLKATPGNWGEGYLFEYQWLRDGDPIQGAWDQFYTPNLFDKGTIISVLVSGKVPDTAPISHQSAGILIAGSRLQASLVGKFQFGSRVWANASGKSSKFQYSYQWFRNGDLIEGENSRSLLLGAIHVDSNISVRVCATIGYNPIDCAEARSVGQIARISLRPIPLVIQYSSPNALNVRAGRALPEGAVYYEWLRDGAVILGENQSTYQIRPADSGHSIRARILVFAMGYHPAEFMSAIRRVK